ncbi:hypothetical protein [Fluviispira sanaruensis]|uniref:Uncharacterized protein n=1 Tax=Fluviispira sanaruensis TaxID=2493639 RepID=A0A4P2VMJ9_FLUSA|nr:hypothetical protein [Fluviispira sanaruensis]BBH54633.1 hypothetical protein JCM31447_31070 [Fluviispira sanaruensis]
MAIDKIIMKKIAVSTVIFSSIGGGIYGSVRYVMSTNKKVQTVPDSVKKSAKDIPADEAFAAQFETNKVANDPVADAEAKKIIAEREKNNSSQKGATEKVELVNSQSETNKDKEKGNINEVEKKDVLESVTTTVRDIDSEFAPSSTKLTRTDFRSVLVAENKTGSNKNFVNGDAAQTQSAEALVPAFATNAHRNSNKQFTNETAQEKTSELPIKKSKGSLLLASNGTLTSLQGRDTSIGAAGYQIKAGTRVLALLPDGLTITSGGPQPTSLSVIGPLDDFLFPSGYIITANALLNPSEDKIYIETNFCASKNNRIKSVSCKGVIKDIRGYTGLSGDIYNNSVWSAVVAFSGATLASIPLSRIERSATINGTIENVSVANTINASLAQGIQSVTQNIQKGFDKSGTQITIPQNSIVHILFTQDTVL